MLELRQDKSSSQLENLPSRYAPSSSAGSQVQIQGGIELESEHSALRFPDSTPSAVAVTGGGPSAAGWSRANNASSGPP